MEVTVEEKERLIALSEGNPGALNVLMQILSFGNKSATKLFDTMESMNMKGSVIWLGYKDICNQRIGTFVARVICRDIEMVEQINALPDMIYHMEKDGRLPVVVGSDS